MDDLRQILSKVQKPGRYIGGETNCVRKKFTQDRISVALAYPDTYEVGMSYLGLRILYHLLNERDDIVCERVFAPWPDMEQELRGNGRRLFSLESKTDIHRFDIVGFSLSYELTYTNVLNMLDLSGITVEAAKRGDDEPLVIAGGACCCNPEPMSAFIDAFLIGDAEEALPGFIDAYRELKRGSVDRKSTLKRLARLGGVYVPRLYSARYEGDKFLGLAPEDDGVPPVVKKNSVADLEKAYYPVKQIVPLVKIVHDRIAVEIMRGCPNGCRFCQAGNINKPVRLRSPGRIREICRETYAATGYERIALLSLSSVNYPYLPELVEGLNADLGDKGVGVSIPSLRVDEAFYALPGILSAVRKAGLTFAPEAAGEGMRRSIGKDIKTEVLERSVRLAYGHGWRRVKLYFMVGFPGDMDEEAKKILVLSRDISRLKREVSGGAAEVKVSVNSFVPKAHTPFQWLGMRPAEGLLRARNILRSGSTKKVTVDFHDVDRSMLEACLAKGDRALAGVIYAAWKKGAKMDGWQDLFDLAAWEGSFREKGLDIRSYALKASALDDVLPWSHIKAGMDEKNLKEEFINSEL